MTDGYATGIRVRIQALTTGMARTICFRLETLRFMLRLEDDVFADSGARVEGGGATARHLLDAGGDGPGVHRIGDLPVPGRLGDFAAAAG